MNLMSVILVVQFVSAKHFCQSTLLPLSNEAFEFLQLVYFGCCLYFAMLGVRESQYYCAFSVVFNLPTSYHWFIQCVPGKRIRLHDFSLLLFSVNSIIT